MAHELYIPPCIHAPPHHLHPPPHDKPLRISVDGPLSSVEKLLPDVPWQVDLLHQQEFQPSALELARVAYRTIYGKKPQPDVDGDLVVREESLGWVNPQKPNEIEYRGKIKGIDYYGVIFDHLVPLTDEDPETLQINLAETEYDGAKYAQTYYLAKIDPRDYTPHQQRVFASHRCCSIREGTTDRRRINESVQSRVVEQRDKTGRFTELALSAT